MTSKDAQELIASITKLTELIEQGGLPRQATDHMLPDRYYEDFRRTPEEIRASLDPAADFEAQASKYHRKSFGIRADREGLPAEERRTAQDAEESFDDSIARHRKRLLNRKY